MNVWFFGRERGGGQCGRCGGMRGNKNPSEGTGSGTRRLWRGVPDLSAEEGSRLDLLCARDGMEKT